MSSAKPPIVNPYAKANKPPPVAHIVAMGRQSQHRISNQHKRKFKLCSNNKKWRKGDQLTLQGEVAFDASRDCKVCRAKEVKKYFPEYTVPHRGHHPKCIHNKQTKGAGVLSTQGVANLAEDKRCKEITRPIQPSERMSAAHLGGAAVFFTPKPKAVGPMTTTATATATTQEQVHVTASDLCKAVNQRVDDPEFCNKHKTKSAPLAMLAFAEEVTNTIKKPKLISHYFDGITMTVPNCEEAGNNPHYHSTVGQKLLLVDWERVFGLKVQCPDANCNGTLDNVRSNFSKDKTLFPIFSLDGPPSWCIVEKMECSCCKRPFFSNDGEVLLNLPAHVADTYPVETTYAVKATSHISRNASDVFASIMITHANGELCSKLLYDAINRAYVGRIKSYYSLAITSQRKETRPYLEKDGTYVKQYPPLGATIRDLYDTAASSASNRWRLSDYERNTREIQGVKCDGIFAQDHTFEPIQNYLKKVGAKAAWDACTQTGEIASAVLVPSTKTKDFAHAAQALLNRPHFNPGYMYSDTWPSKKEYWQSLGVDGRLGLFHHQKRIIGTLRKTHCDYFDAITDLLAGLYSYHPEDYERLLSALKDGSLSRKNKKYTSSEITELKSTRLFRDRYAKYLRKQMKDPQTIIQNLDDWFCEYKVTASNPNKPAYGRLDPIRKIPLFTDETKTAVENCKTKAIRLSDPYDIEKMYQEISPNPNASHTLSEYLSNRGESKLEAFHDRFAHFANCGMRESLADNLNLAGTTRYNLAIRHVRSLASRSRYENPQVVEERKKIPDGWEKVVPFFNQSELWYVNEMAKAVGCQYPFPKAEVLVQDNGERFFSQYITTTLPSLKLIKPGEFDECLCHSCARATSTMSQQQQPLVLKDKAKDNEQDGTNHNKVPAPATRTTALTKRKMPAKNTTRQPTERQPTQCAVANTNYIQPSPNIDTCSPQYFYMMPQLIPMQYQLPYFVPPIRTACCDKYAEWFKRRVGRPPHHQLCPNR